MGFLERLFALFLGGLIGYFYARYEYKKILDRMFKKNIDSITSVIENRIFNSLKEDIDKIDWNKEVDDIENFISDWLGCGLHSDADQLQ